MLSRARSTKQHSHASASFHSTSRQIAFIIITAYSHGDTFCTVHTMAAVKMNAQQTKISHACSVDISPSMMSMCPHFACALHHAHQLQTDPRHRLAEAVPLPGSGVTLPLDLRAIAARCTNAYHAPQRFAAVQFAFNNPRCRVLIFHTGRLVGTGQSIFSAAFIRALVAASGIFRRRRHRLRGPDASAHGHPQGSAAAGGRGQRARAHPQV